MENEELFVSDQCRDFYTQWLGLVEGGLMPLSRDFLTDPDPALISNVYILEVTPEGPLIRFMGTGLVELRGRDLTNTIFGAGLPDAELAGLVRNCADVVKYPCGLSEIAEFSTPIGRQMRMETVMLPLGVDEGRMQRLCTFSHILEASGNDDLAEMRFQAGQKVMWIDIGSGMPGVSPATNRQP